MTKDADPLNLRFFKENARISLTNHPVLFTIYRTIHNELIGHGTIHREFGVFHCSQILNDYIKFHELHVQKTC